MSDIYDTDDGRAALEKVDYCFAEVYRADAILAMIEWLAEQHPFMQMEWFQARWLVSIGAPDDGKYHPDDALTLNAPTLDEALVRAVLASKEKT